MKSTIIKFSLLSLVIAFTSCSSEESTNENSGDSDNANSQVENAQDNAQKNDGPFDIKSGVINYEMKKIGGELTATHTLYFDNYGKTIRLDETIDGETSTFVFDDDAKKGATKWAGRDGVNKLSMRQGEINTYVAVRGTSGFTKGADETVLGKSCEVYANNATTPEGDSMVKFWLHKGIALKEINHLGMGYMFEAVKIQEKGVDKSTFSLLNEVD